MKSNNRIFRANYLLTLSIGTFLTQNSGQPLYPIGNHNSCPLTQPLWGQDHYGGDGRFGSDDRIGGGDCSFGAFSC